MTISIEEPVTTALPLWDIDSYRIEGWTPERTYYLGIVQSRPHSPTPWRGSVYKSSGEDFAAGFPTSREAKAAVEAHIRSLP